jgi:hypothetical protein
MTLTVLYHRVCCHILGIASRTEIECGHALLVAAGYHQLRTRVATDEDVMTVLFGSAICDTCRIDPTRGAMPAVQSLLSEPAVQALLPERFLGGES